MKPSFFRSRHSLILVIFTFALLQSGQALASISNKVTHVMNNLSDGQVGSSMHVSWSPKSEYSGTAFTYYILRYQLPDGSWHNKYPSSASYNLPLSSAGKYCFKVRGVINNSPGVAQYGSYSGEECPNVDPAPVSIAGKTTHSISLASTTITENDNISVNFNPLSAYNNLNFDYVLVRTVRPNGSPSSNNVYSGNTFNIAANMPGNWCFKVRASHNNVLGNYSDNGSSRCVNVLPLPSGTALLDENNDKWLNNREALVWNTSAVTNANYFRVIIRNLTSGRTSVYTPQTLNYNSLQFSLNQAGYDDYKTTDNASISLQACNNNNRCINASTQNLTLVKTSDLTYFSGKPKHIVQFSAEMPYKDETNLANFVSNKRWNVSTIADVIYDLDLKHVFDSYLYQYNLPQVGVASHISGSVNTNNRLFDAFSFTNQRFKVSDKNGQQACNKMTNTFTDGPMKQLKADIKECVRNYFDVVFGVKNSVSLGERQYFSEQRESFLDLLHDSSLLGNKPVGFYLVIPSGEEDQQTTLDRRKLFIDEALEQYALFRATHANSNVQLAGFYQMRESTTTDSSDTYVTTHVRNYIKGYSSELEFNSSSYNKLAGFVGAGDFGDHCERQSYRFSKCLERFSAVEHENVARKFDDVSIQPNATLRRFDNRRHAFTLAEDEKNIHSTGVDIEMLHWLSKDLFKPLAEKRHLFIYDNNSPAETEFSIHFEYNRRHTGSTDTAAKNYKIQSLAGEGDFGDISRYADYIMSEFPDIYKNGSRPILYDDNGGVFYCFLTGSFASTTPSNRSCAPHATHGAIITSFSDVRSMYSFVNATRNTAHTYSANTNIQPDKPLIAAGELGSQEIAYANFGYSANSRNLTFQSLVRARLTPYKLHQNTASSSCSKMPEVRIEFLNSGGNFLSHATIGKGFLSTPNVLSCDNFMQVKANEEATYSYFMPFKPVLDEDQWSLMKRDGIYVPPHATQFRAIFKGEDIVGETDTVESILYYRSEYKLY